MWLLFSKCVADNTIVICSLCLQSIKQDNTFNHLGIIYIKGPLTSHHRFYWKQHQNVSNQKMGCIPPPPAPLFPTLPPLYAIPSQQSTVIGIMIYQGILEVYPKVPPVGKSVCIGSSRLEASVVCSLSLIFQLHPTSCIIEQAHFSSPGARGKTKIPPANTMPSTKCQLSGFKNPAFSDGGFYIFVACAVPQ